MKTGRLLLAISSFLLTLGLLRNAVAAPQFPQPGVSVVEQTRRALNALTVATNTKTRTVAIRSLPFATTPWSKPDVRRNHDRPWEPFDTSHSRLCGQASLVVSAVRLLRGWQRVPATNAERHERNHDVVLAAMVLATVGGQETANAALPDLLKSLAYINGSRDYVARSEMANCLMTLYGAKKVAVLIAVQTQSPNPALRAAAATVLGMRDDLFGEPRIEKAANGTYRPIPAQAALRDSFMAQIPRLAQLAAHDPVPGVRRVALNALDRGAYGSQTAPWQAAFLYLNEAANRRDTTGQMRLVLARLFAVIPSDIAPLSSSVRRLLRDESETTRGYATVAFSHIVAHGHGEPLAMQYIKQLRSSDLATRKNAVSEIEAIVESLWGYGWRPAKGVDWLHDDRIRAARQSAGKYRRYTPNDETASRHRNLIAALGLVVTSDTRREVRQRAAQSLEHIGNAVHKALWHGSQIHDAMPDMLPMRDALTAASRSIALSDPATGARLSKLAARMKMPEYIFGRSPYVQPHT